MRRLLLLPLAISLVAPAAILCQAPEPATLRSQVRRYRTAHAVEIVRELADLLAIPNVASDSANIRANARHLVTMLERRGVRARLLESAGSPPAVFGELSTPGATRT